MIAAILLMTAALPAAGPTPLALHPANPHYFLFRGKPTVLVGSSEHYGAVLNLDFDAGPYLDELQRRGLNLTRVFSGTYREVPGSFNIKDNTLAPRPGRFACPWETFFAPELAAKVEGFRLDRWNDAYFARLKSFVAEAGKRGIVVEYTLFCPLYEDNLWAVSPMNARNNTNGVGNCPRTEVFTLKHGDLLAVQEAFVRKAVGELAGFDNVFFEICNEPYFGGVTPDWQARIAATIAETEKDLPRKHLIAQNIANGSARIEHPDPRVSIFNFHYATPPAAVAENSALNRPIGDDETGFRGTGDRVYRVEAWEFLLAGGALFDHLDYSFTTDHEDGTAPIVDPTPGGGGPALRAQFRILKDFLEGFEFVRMAPDPTSIAGVLPEGRRPSVRALSEKGKAYAIYFHGGSLAEVAIDLPAGRYRVEWINPRTGKVDGSRDLDHPGGRAVLRSPEYAEDLALRIVARPGAGAAKARAAGNDPTRN